MKEFFLKQKEGKTSLYKGAVHEFAWQPYIKTFILNNSKLTE